MAIYKVRPEARTYGHAIGILVLDRADPFIPGDVGNASTYDYPVLYKTIDRLGEQVLMGDPDYLNDVIKAAQYLEHQGVKGITGNCGFLIHYQQNVAQVVDIPVFLSSLLQIPAIDRSLGNHRAIGIITASSEHLTTDLLAMAGATPTRKIHIEGLMDKPEFRSTFYKQKGFFDSEKLQEELVQIGKMMVEDHPDIGAILLECSVLPPYARAIQDVTHLPVFDFITMIDYFYASMHRKSYGGGY